MIIYNIKGKDRGRHYLSEIIVTGKKKQGGTLQFLQKGNPIRVPKNLKTVKTIKINNGVLTGKIDKNNNVYWFRNDKYITPNQMKTYKYYDSKIGAYRRLGNRDEYVRKQNKDLINTQDTLATPVITPNIDKLTKFWNTNIENKTEEDYRQSIPFNGEHIILRTKGNMNLTDVPINLLDSIAINSGRSNTNFWKNAALIGKESTFGGYSKYLGRPIYPETKFTPEGLTNNHVYFLNEYDDYLTELGKKYNYYDVLDDNSRIKAEENAKYALEHKLIKDRNPHYSNYVLADAFKRYTSNPDRYNPGQKNYVPMINNIEQELKEEKQLQNYWNTRGKEFYNKGQKEGIGTMKQGGKMNILEFLKNGSGIHIKKKNRGKFTSYCGGKVTDECIRKAKASGNPTLVKRATFAANARKWKHKKGGKAFVEGVNVLDSNPKMSKAASRKVKKADDGTKLNFQNLNSDTGKAIGSTLINGLSAGFQAKQMNDAINEYELASKAKLKKILNGVYSKDYYNQALQTMNPNENLSSVVLQKRAYDIGQQEAQKMYNEAKDKLDQQMVGLKQYANEQTQSNFYNVLGGITQLGSLLNNKSAGKVDNGTPSKTNFWNTPTIKNSQVTGDFWNTPTIANSLA